MKMCPEHQIPLIECQYRGRTLIDCIPVEDESFQICLEHNMVTSACSNWPHHLITQ